MTAQKVLATVQALGGVLTAKPPDAIHYELPIPPTPELLAAIRGAKPELLRLLHDPLQPCPQTGEVYRWLDRRGRWHCGTCEPSPDDRRFRGLTEAVLRGRYVCFQVPAGDLPAPGSWARTPSGSVVELVLYEATGAEVLMRTFKGKRLAWFRPEQLKWEIDWA